MIQSNPKYNDSFSCTKFVAGSGHYYAIAYSPATKRAMTDAIAIMQKTDRIVWW